jgi:hypothetical protein
MTDHANNNVIVFGRDNRDFITVFILLVVFAFGNDITVPDDVYKPYQNCADGSVISSGESTESTVMASSSVIEQVGDMAGYSETCDEMATDMYESIEEQYCEIQMHAPFRFVSQALFKVNTFIFF